MSIRVERQIYFSFPDQPHDVEGVVLINDNFLLLAKVAKGFAPAYTLPLKEKSPKSIRPELLATLGQGVSAQRITGAALTPNRDRIALCSYNYAQVFELSGDESWRHLDRCSNRVIRFAATQIEGCEWDGDNLLLVSEDQHLFQLPFPRKTERAD